MAREKIIRSVKLFDKALGGFRTVNVEMSIDYDALARRVGARALASKRGKASEVYGAVEGKIAKEGGQ